MACKYIIKVGSEFDSKLNLNLKKDKVIEENEAFLAINQYLDKARTEGKEVAKAVTQFGVETFGEGTPEFIVSSIEEVLQNNYEDSLELARQQLNKIVSLYIDNFEKKPSFVDLLNILVYNNNKERVRNLFPIHVEAYRKDNNLSEEAKKKAFSEVFGTFKEVTEAYLTLAEKSNETRPIQTAKESEVRDEIVKKNSENPEITGFDSNNDPIKGKTPIQENTSEIKGVHISVPFTRDSEGNPLDNSETLFTNRIVDNTQVLEPGKIKVGDKLQVKTMSPNTPITLYNEDGSIQRDENGNVVTEPFNLYASKRKLIPGSPEYIAEMPVGLFVKGSSKPAMLLPSNSYFNQERESDPKKAEEFANQVLETRNNLYSAESTGTVMELTVSDKTGGTNDFNQEYRTIAELDIENTIVVTDGKKNVVNLKGEQVEKRENLKDGLQGVEGFTTLLVRDANNDLREISLTASNLSTQSVDSVIMANEIQTLSYLIKQYQSNPEFFKKEIEKHAENGIKRGYNEEKVRAHSEKLLTPLKNKIEFLSKIQQDILNTHKVDLLDKTQFRDYIGKFTRLGETSPLNTSGNSLGLDSKSGKYITQKTPIISALQFLEEISGELRNIMSAENTLVKQNLYTRENKEYVYPANVNNFFNISKEGNVTEASYVDLIKNSFTTNLRTYKSPNDPDGKAYAYVQPSVKFKSEETLTKESQEQKKATQPRVEDKIIPTQPSVKSRNEKINIYAGTKENADLSNFAIRPFKIENGDTTAWLKEGEITFQSVEQYFQAYKVMNTFTETENNIKLLKEIMSTSNGAKLKSLGKRRIDGFNKKDWDSSSKDIMREALTESFLQNPKALQRLLLTGNSTLTHTQDKTRWGKDFPKLLMEVRKELKPTQQASEVKIEVINEKYSRDSLDNDSDSMYLFTDNAKRTSTRKNVPDNIDKDSWYYKKYKNTTDRPLHYGTLSNPTSAVIRGKNNAYPISTMSAMGVNWTNENFDLFKDTIDDEIVQIKQDLSKFKTLKLGDFRIGQGGRFAKLPSQHQSYLDSKLLELGIDNSGKSPKVIKSTTQQTNDVLSDEVLEAKLRESKEILSELSIDPNSPALVEINKLLGIKYDLGKVSENVSKKEASSKVKNLKSDSLANIPLNIMEINQLTDYIFNILTENLILNSKISTGENLTKAKQTFKDIIEERREYYNSFLETIEGFDNMPNSVPLAVRQGLGKLETIENSWNTFEGLAVEKLLKYNGIKKTTGQDEQISELNQSNEYEKELGKSVLEVDPKMSTSAELKMFLSNIKKTDKNGEGITGVFNVPISIPFDEVYDQLKRLLNNPVDIDSDFNTVIEKLKSVEGKNKYWANQVVKKLESADTPAYLKNQFMYDMIQHNMVSKFVMLNKSVPLGMEGIPGVEPVHKYKIYDSNSLNPLISVQDAWRQELRESDLVKLDENTGNYIINKEFATKLYEESYTNKVFFSQTLKNLDNVKKVTEEDVKRVKKLLADFGVVLDENTVRESINDGSAKTFLSKFNNFIKSTINSKDVVIVENNFLASKLEIGGLLKDLARKELKHGDYNYSLSYTDGDKNVYGVTLGKHATDINKKLKAENSQLRDDLLSTSFNQNSVLLKGLAEDKEFREKFFIEHMGLNALKEMGVSISGKDNSVTDFGEADQEAVKLALFMDTKQGNLGKNRMARMFFPTMSDKSLMMHITVPAYDFKADSLKDDKLGAEVLDALMDQVVEPELKRAYKYHHEIKSKGLASNIKGYDSGAQMINSIPALNDVKLKDSETNVAAALGSADFKTYEDFLNAYNEAIRTKLETIVNNLSQKKLTEWKSYGLISPTNKNLKLDETYMKDKADYNTTVAAKSFVINSLISNQNINMAIAGDPALYSSGKLSDNKEKNKFFNNGNIGSPKNGVASYIEAARDVVATNINKRMALLIAPGYTLANSKGKTYQQLFIEDHIDITSNADYLLDIFYPGNENNSELKNMISDYRINKDSVKLKIIQDYANDNYPNIAAYFDIEGTDAQEYTTMFEHLTVLEGQGRIKDASMLESMKQKILNQKKSELKGEAIQEKDKFSEQELKLAYQPIKPVHTGFNKSEGVDAMNMVYVKSSSFPLLPQLTQGTQLDSVRKLMEKMENGKNTVESLTLENLTPVRASYQTANKVGATTKGVQLFNQNGDFNEALNMDNALDMFTRTLSRENFRIQQDVPLKSAKKKEDLVSEGTQPTKLLFGNGVMDLEGFKYKGEEIGGEKLQEKFEAAQIKLTKKALEILNKRLGYTPGETIKDVKAFADNLQKVLIEEASGKDYSNQDLDALQLVLNTKIPVNGKNITADLTSEEYDYLLGNKDNISDKAFNDLAKKLGEDTIDDILESDIEDFIVDNFEFKSPLWGSPNGVKYESLLNSIITNSVSKYKMPGYSYVAGSEAGFKQVGDMESVKDFNKIIYTSNFSAGTGTELQAANVVTDKNGNKTLKKAQVMLNPKLRDINGNIIDLWEKVNGKYTYLNVSKSGRLELKDGVIDPTLLDLSSFRIPTSGHVSMAQIEVVGILPPSSGDLMVVPRNLTTQKGLDFDVDKENIYKKWTTLDNGKIRPILNKDSSKLTGMQKLKMDKKLIENDLVDIHTAVLSNTSPEMQKKIQKVLSMDTAENQAAAIQQAISGVQEVDEDFAILSDSFQKSQIALGKAGKVAIGGYSNAVTLNSTANILAKKGTPLVIKMEEGSGTFKIGNIASDLALGKENTLEAKGFPKDVVERFRRTTADVLEERQNTATDNVKAMVMPKTNIDALTLNVDSLLSLLGFDMDFKRYTGIELRAEGNLNAVVDKNGKDVTKLEDIDNSAEYYRAISIPYTLLSQPIIREYVEMVNMEDNIYNPKSLSQIKKDVKEKLLKKYDGNDSVATESLTGGILFDNLDKNKANASIQKNVLLLFSELDSAAGVVNGIQTNLKIDNGLGANFIEANQKAEYLSKLGTQEDEKFSVENSQALIGDFKTKEEYEALLDKDGYVYINGTYIKPTTINGIRLVKSIEAYQDLFDNKTIYSKPAVDTILKRAPRLFGKGFLTGKALGDFQYKVFKEMKKYLFSDPNFEVFNLQQNETKENKRNSLFIDTDNNTSLASYIKGLLTNPSLPVKLKNNILLKSLTFDIHSNGVTPSFLNYSASKGEAFDQNQLNDALIELMEQPIILEKYNGREYTSYDLGRDLIAYSYMDNGGIQEAKQFNKLIPVNLLEEYGFSKNVRNFQKNEAALNNQLGFNPSDIFTNTTFEEQLVINMAQEVPQTYKEKTIKKKDATGETFNFEVKDNKPYISEIKKDKYGNTLYRVYKKDANQNEEGEFFTYTYVGTKGNNRLPGYNPKTLKPKANNSSQVPLKESKNDTFNLESENIEDILSAVSTYDNIGPQRQALAKELLTLVKGKGIKVKVKEVTKVNSPAAYLFEENTIEFNSERLKTYSDRLLANAILHETVHALTGNQINEFVNFDGTYKVGKSQVPKSLQNIVEMYKIAREKVEEDVNKDKQKNEPRETVSKLTRDYLDSKSYKLTENEKKLYAVKDIHEFLAHTIAEVANKQELFKGMKYENKNFIEKLVDYYKQFLKDIFGENTGNIAAQTTMETIKFIKEFKAPTNPSYNSNSSISSALDVMDSKYGPIVSKPSTEELSNSDKNTTFNDPFTSKCKL